jgi:hypothetical protein
MVSSFVVYNLQQVWRIHSNLTSRFQRINCLECPSLIIPAFSRTLNEPIFSMAQPALIRCNFKVLKPKSKIALLPQLRSLCPNAKFSLYQISALLYFADPSLSPNIPIKEPDSNSSIKI